MSSGARREAAELLREQADDGYGVSAESVAYALGLDMDDEEFGDEDVFEMLADLIDPVCEIGSAEPIIDEAGLAIGWDFRLTCGHTVQMPWNDAPAYCPYCGARVASE